MADFVAFLFVLFSHVVPLPNKGVISKSSCVSVLYIESLIRVQQDSTLNCYLYTQILCDLFQVLGSLYSDNATTLLGCCPRGTIICFYVTSSPSPSYHECRHHFFSCCCGNVQLLEGSWWQPWYITCVTEKTAPHCCRIFAIID